jgi:predicted small integral membrane protein
MIFKLGNTRLRVILRSSKAAMVLAMALLASLVAFNNITDYATNFAFVRHVFLMDTTFPDNGILYRSIDQAWVHHAGYIAIIALEVLTATLCWIGGVVLLRARHFGDAAFHSARAWAVSGLTLGFLTWQVCFMTVGGEWFGMWMSQQWNGTESAFRFFVTFLLVLIYLVMPDEGIDSPATSH